jgi:hypothetical protein
VRGKRKRGGLLLSRRRPAVSTGETRNRSLTNALLQQSNAGAVLESTVVQIIPRVP